MATGKLSKAIYAGNIYYMDEAGAVYSGSDITPVHDYMSAVDAAKVTNAIRSKLAKAGLVEGDE